MTPELREKCANTLRFLASDAVQKANSGHPGAPMGLADVAFVLWNKFLRFHPQDPQWPNRDRFVLSAGHASMLLYGLLHLSGYNLSLEELQQFRQWGSRTPGHPEWGVTPGVECTTGPLGAGFGNGVGMALGLKMASARFNTTEHPLLDPFVYIICSDGDAQEGVCAESASLAGHWGLGNLIAIYDQNRITIGGSIELSMDEDVGKRFEAYGWHVQSCDGHDHEAVEVCLQKAQETLLQPSLIVAKTTIAKGAPNKAGTAGSHGSPLGVDEIQQAKKLAGWPLDVEFYVPEETRQVFGQRQRELKVEYDLWQERFEQWRKAYPELAKSWKAHTEHQTPPDLLEKLVARVAGQAGATRKLSQGVIQEAARLVPSMVGGSADLEPSTLSLIQTEKSIVRASLPSNQAADPSFAGRNIHFGVREHGMGSICNGLYLSGAWLPYCATFVVFSDYMRASIRLAAISKIPTIFLLTHDSFWVGEDGPTHQPVEHNWTLRMIPNLNVWRPSDGVETAAAWAHALARPHGNTPSALLLTRQGVIPLNRSTDFDPQIIWNGGYIVADAPSAQPQVTLVSSGSEGGATQSVREHLQAQGVETRHVSMPCLERFTAQTVAYQESILPPSSRIIAIEAGVEGPWYQHADYVIGKNTFGESAPGNVLAEQFGLTAEQLIPKITQWLEQHL